MSLLAATRGTAKRRPSKPTTVTVPGPEAPPEVDWFYGAAPLGSSLYPIPTTGEVRYVSPTGSTSNNGLSALAPWPTLTYAVANAPSGATIVMMAGVYREGAVWSGSGTSYVGGVIVSGTKVLTIQNHPGHVVWLDGSVPVTGWVLHTAGVWRKDGWTATFPYNTYADTVTPSRFIDPAYPYSIYPDQVFIDGMPLEQVGSTTQLGPGKFYVDQVNDKLYIGTDPAGKTVEATDKSWAVFFNGGAGCKLLGIGVRRYGTDYTIHGAVRSYKPGAIFENDVFLDNSDAGLTCQTGSGQIVRHCTFAYCGHMGMHHYNAPTLLCEYSWFYRNNASHFAEWAAAGAKFTGISGMTGAHLSGLRVAYCLFDETYDATGCWLDVALADFEIVGCWFRGNGIDGLDIEICGHGITADNLYEDNGRYGLYVSESNSVETWHETILRSGWAAVRYWDANRYNPQGQVNSTAYVPYHCKDNVLCNIVASQVAGSQRVISNDDGTNLRNYNQMVVTQRGNAWHRQSSTQPATFATIEITAGTVASYPSLAAFKTATGKDDVSWYAEGVNLFVMSSLDARMPVSSPAYQQGVAVPTNVATAMGVSGGIGKSPGIQTPRGRVPVPVR